MGSRLWRGPTKFLGVRVDSMVLTSGGIIAWLMAGLACGWVAGKIVHGRQFGLIGDLAVSLIGSLLGGLVADAFLPDSVGLFASLGFAVVGASLLLVLIRVVGTRTEVA